MFTGLVDAIGVIETIRPRPDVGVELRVRCPYEDLEQGESISLNGICLTVRECAAGWFTTAAMEATRVRTTLADWRSGKRVNLERALRAGDRLGGHMVLGHVDAVARVLRVSAAADATTLECEVPEELDDLVVPQGSITLDGVSLTISALPRPYVVQVALIEYTKRHTTLGELAGGDLVHVEADVIGKYVRRQLGTRRWESGARSE
ncbi:MAG: riboflavin synthase [Gemmatimonadaceae bacterium]